MRAIYQQRYSMLSTFSCLERKSDRPWGTPLVSVGEPQGLKSAR